MNREIKFRAWHKEYEQYIGFYSYGLFMYEDGQIYAGNMNITSRIELEQYTETSISHEGERFGCYDGDIVEAYKHNETKYILEVTYRNGTFMFGNWTQIEFCNIFRRPKVIGNKYEKIKSEDNDE